MKGHEPWSVQMWEQLNQLRAVRISSRLLGDLQSTARSMTVSTQPPSRLDASSARSTFAQGNRHYEAGRFNEASESYRVALKSHPNFWDAWNNLALAEMHAGNDLVALFVLSALIKNNPKYAGGSINASVCLARLGEETAAYDIAAAIARKHSRMPMAQYNMAWFENARGNYESAQTHNAQAMSSVSDYGVARWLQAVNAMESGRSIGPDEWNALPARDRLQGMPVVSRRVVSVGSAAAYSGDTTVVRLPKGSQLVVSEKQGDWYAVYWPVGNVKRRLWIHWGALGRQVRVAVPEARIMLGSKLRGTVVRGQPLTVTVANGSWLWVESVKGSPNLQGWIKKADVEEAEEVAGDDAIAPFLGTWKGQWSDVTVSGFTIVEVNGRPNVTVRGYEIWDEKLENGRLTHRARVVTSGWEFTYTLEPVAGGLSLDVFRHRDSKRFTGKLTRDGEV